MYFCSFSCFPFRFGLREFVSDCASFRSLLKFYFMQISLLAKSVQILYPYNFQPSASVCSLCLACDHFEGKDRFSRDQTHKGINVIHLQRSW